MTRAKQNARVAQSFAFREFVYGQSARGFVSGTAHTGKPKPAAPAWFTTSVVRREWAAA